MLALMPKRADGSIHCRIDKISLINPGDYVALSYCWADPDVTVPVTVNNTSVKITVNLEDALQHLQPWSSLRIWVDALCINHADDQEHGWEVRLMKQIYEKSSQVHAWVGAASHRSSKAIEFLKHPRSLDVIDRHESGVSKFPQPEIYYRPPQAKVYRKLLDDFFDRPY